MRIVSLLPSATEIVCALGLGDELVGRSPECDYPPRVRDLPVVVSTRLDSGARTSAEIDARVQAHLHGGGSLYHIDESRLRGADPDLILTQGLCEVCAASIGEVRDVATRLPRQPRILSLDPTSLDGVFTCILEVGAATGTLEAAEVLVAGLRDRVRAVESSIRTEDRRPRAFCLEWLDPPINAGHWVPDMVAAAGAVDGLATAGERSRKLTWREIALYAPEVLVAMPCGYDLGRTRREMETLVSNPAWSDLPAVRNGRVWLVDGSAYFNRPGPRLVDGVEMLAHIAHPDRFKNIWWTEDLQRWGI